MKPFVQAKVYSPMPDNMVQLQEAANAVFMDLDMNNQDLLVRAVKAMRDKAQLCIAAEGGVFKGRKLQKNKISHCYIFQ